MRPRVLRGEFHHTASTSSLISNDLNTNFVRQITIRVPFLSCATLTDVRNKPLESSLWNREMTVTRSGPQCFPVLKKREGDGGAAGCQGGRPGHEIKKRMQRDTGKTNREEGLPARFKQPQPLLNCTDYFLAPNTKTQQLSQDPERPVHPAAEKTPLPGRRTRLRDAGMCKKLLRKCPRLAAERKILWSACGWCHTQPNQLLDTPGGHDKRFSN